MTTKKPTTALVLDVETKILYDIVPPADARITTNPLKTNKFYITHGAVAIVAEDSKVARAMLEGLNTRDGNSHQMHVTGKDAWERIQQLAQEAEAEVSQLAKSRWSDRS